MNEKPKFVYVTYIAASPEKVWNALTKPDISEKYWFGYRVAAAGRPFVGFVFFERFPAVNQPPRRDLRAFAVQRGRPGSR